MKTETSAGWVDGAHYSEHRDRVLELMRESRSSDAVVLLLRLTDAIEAESRAESWGVPSWHYHELAKIYRNAGELDNEVRVLRRLAKHNSHSDPLPKRLIEAEELLRLEQAADQ